MGGKRWIVAVGLMALLLAGGARAQAAGTEGTEQPRAQEQAADEAEVRRGVPKRRGNEVKGWYRCDGKRYYVTSKGARAVGWQKIGRHLYFFRKNGTMAASKWVKNQGKYYYFGTKGRMRTGWLTLGKKKYYLDEEGARATGNYFIGDKGYHFNRYGVYKPRVKVSSRVDPDKPMVALTFDDGPGPYTERLLKCLEKNHALATFFMVGSSVDRYRDTVKKVYDMGCEIGNHSWNHSQLPQLDGSALASQISSTNQVIRNITGHNPTLLRPPYGAYNSAVAAAAGVPLILWEVDTLDWKTRDVQSTVRSVMADAKDGSIVLMHDIHLPTVMAVEQIIPQLKAKGFQLVTVSELAKYKKKPMQAGSAYRYIR